MTLYSPDMEAMFTVVCSVFHEKGVSLDGIDVVRHPNGTITAEFRFNSRVKLAVWWSHTEQSVFMRLYDRDRTIGRARKRGRFRHVSQVADAKAYWSRVRKWMNREIEWSEYQKSRQAAG